MIHASYNSGIPAGEILYVSELALARSLALLGSLEWGLIVSGDDTCVTDDVPQTYWTEANAALGFTTKRATGINFLAKDYSMTGVYTNCIFRAIQNFLFKEERFVNDNPYITLVNAVVIRDLVREHPARSVLDKFLRTVPVQYIPAGTQLPPSYLRNALTMSIHDIPVLIDMALKTGASRQSVTAVADAFEYTAPDAYDVLHELANAKHTTTFSMKGRTPMAVAIYPTLSKAIAALFRIGDET